MPRDALHCAVLTGFHHHRARLLALLPKPPEDNADVDKAAPPTEPKEDAEASAKALADFQWNARPIVDYLGRQVTMLAEELSEADIATHRKGIRAQNAVTKMKLAASRTAAGVSLQNQAAEMENAFQKQLVAKVNSLQDSGNEELKEAMARSTALKWQLDTSKAKCTEAAGFEPPTAAPRRGALEPWLTHLCSTAGWQ